MIAVSRPGMVNCGPRQSLPFVASNLAISADAKQPKQATNKRASPQSSNDTLQPTGAGTIASFGRVGGHGLSPSLGCSVGPRPGGGALALDEGNRMQIEPSNGDHQLVALLIATQAIATMFLRIFLEAETRRNPQEAAQIEQGFRDEIKRLVSDISAVSVEKEAAAYVDAIFDAAREAR